MGGVRNSRPTILLSFYKDDEETNKMLIETTILTLTIALLLSFFGIYVGKKGLWLSLSGSLILMILGILLFNSPIAFMSGATINTVTPLQDVVTYDYLTQDATLNLVLAWVFLLTGFFGILISSNKLYNMRFEGYEEHTEI